MNLSRILAWIMIGLIVICFVAMLVTLFRGELNLFMFLGTILVILLIVAWLIIKNKKKKDMDSGEKDA